MQPTKQAADQEPDEFRYGWRYVKDAQTGELVEVPLTLEDVLHPQEGDVIPERIGHNDDRDYLTRAFRTRDVGPPVVQVTSDLLIDFGVPGVRPVSPDVGIIVGLREQPPPSTGTLRLAKTGGTCRLVVEVVSPDKRDNDVVKKVALYHEVKVPQYVIIDQQRDGGPLTIVAYEWAEAGYVRLPLDELGRLPLPWLGLRLRIDGQRTVCEEIETGREVADFVRLYREHEALERRDQEREREMEAAIDRAQNAERDARQQELAKEEARRLAEQEAKDREEAQRLARREAKAREEAESRAADAARELALLREQLRQLQGGNPGP